MVANETCVLRPALRRCLRNHWVYGGESFHGDSSQTRKHRCKFCTRHWHCPCSVLAWYGPFSAVGLQWGECRCRDITIDPIRNPFKLQVVLLRIYPRCLQANGRQDSPQKQPRPYLHLRVIHEHHPSSLTERYFIRTRCYFTVCLTALSIQNVSSNDWIILKKLIWRIWKEAIMDYFMYYSTVFLQ
jgi:hypothetical protein